MMAPRNRPVRRSDHEIRQQEVLRANRELAAYFKGERTEREARSALKTIKAFVRDRERTDPASRLPLPVELPPRGAKARKPPKPAASTKARQRRRIVPKAAAPATKPGVEEREDGG
jgi:hypothetical protein